MASQPPGNQPIPLAIQNLGTAPISFTDSQQVEINQDLEREAKRIADLNKSYIQAAAISVKAGELAVNTRQIEELTRQLKYNNDCEILKTIIKEHAESLKNLVSSFIKEQTSIKKKFLPIIRPPSPTPWSIVRWVKKLIFGNSWPQVKALFGLILQLISLIKALVNLLAAVQQAVERAAQCADQLADVVKDAALDIVETAVDQTAQSVGEAVGTAIATLDQQLGGAITDAVAAIAEMDQIVGTVSVIDTSSLDAFEASLSAAVSQIDAAGEIFMASQDTDNLPIVPGNSNVTVVTAAATTPTTLNVVTVANVSDPTNTSITTIQHINPSNTQTIEVTDGITVSLGGPQPRVPLTPPVTPPPSDFVFKPAYSGPGGVA